MKPGDIEILKLELKYCERCGGLWLRIKGEGEVYCAPCSAAISKIAIERRSKRGPRLPILRDLDSCIDLMPRMLKAGRA